MLVHDLLSRVSTHGTTRNWQFYKSKIVETLLRISSAAAPLGWARALMKWKNALCLQESKNLGFWCNADFRLAYCSPLCRYCTWSLLAISELSSQWPRRFCLSPSGITSYSLSVFWSTSVGKAAGLFIYWQDTAYRLVIPLRQVVLAQLYKYHHQSGNAVSGKLIWKQRKPRTGLSLVSHTAFIIVLIPPILAKRCFKNKIMQFFIYSHLKESLVPRQAQYCSMQSETEWNVIHEMFVKNTSLYFRVYNRLTKLAC